MTTRRVRGIALHRGGELMAKSSRSTVPGAEWVIDGDDVAVAWRRSGRRTRGVVWVIRAEDETRQAREAPS